MVPIRMVNRFTSVWELDAKEFKPERWLEEHGIPAKAKEVRGHHHLPTFVDGPRTYLAKSFALAEFKVRLFPCGLPAFSVAVVSCMSQGGIEFAYPESYV